MTEEQAILDDVVGESKPAEKKEEPQEEAQESQEEPKPAEDTEEEQPAEEPETEEQKPTEEEQPETAEPAPEKEQKTEEKKAEAPSDEEKKPAPKPEVKQKPVREKIGNNVVLVGKKPTMNYVLAAVTQFSDGLDEIHIKSRGRSISRAVDVAEVVRNRFVQGLTTDITIGTQEITDERNNKLNISTIDIALKK